ncbi:MAG: PHP domain-containing protein [Tissierellales bacterium]
MNAKIKKSDLHIHTTFSDGSLPPHEVLKWAYHKNIYAIAISDHDTIEGVEFAIKSSKLYGIIVIPGVELSCTFLDEEIHLLGYYFDLFDTDLAETLRILKNSREIRGVKIIDKLNTLGFSLSIKEVYDITSKGVIGRVHIAKAMVRKNYVSSVQEAFDKYLNKNRAAYVDRYRLSLEDGIDLIHNAGGAAVIAHPGLIKKDTILSEILKLDIDGIEAIHSKHAPKDVLRYKQIANDCNIIITGGSDFHCEYNDNIPALGDYFVDYYHASLLYRKANYYKERRGV